MNRLIARDQDGIILAVTVFIMVFITVTILAIANFTINHFVRLGQRINETNALLATEAAVEQAIHEINTNSSFAGWSTEQTFVDDAGDDYKATYIASVTDLANGDKEIEAVAYVYVPRTAADWRFARKLRVTLTPNASGNYAVQAGPGGLIMNNTASIVNGSVYVNGTIEMNNSAQIGTLVTPIETWAAHESCPVIGGPAYPEACTFGEPITFGPNPIAHVYGDVRANNQLDNQLRMSHNGVVQSSGVPPISLPAHDRAAQIAAYEDLEDDASGDQYTYTGSAKSCTTNGGMVDWGDNLGDSIKIVGDVTVSKTCIVTVKADVWITGRLILENQGTVRTDAAFTDPADRPDIIVDGAPVTSGSGTDGSMDLNNNSNVLPNLNGVGLRFITYHSANSCTVGNPGCSISGSDLFNSIGIETITIENSLTASNIIFYARWSQVTLRQSGQVGALTGQTVKLDNTGNVSFNNITGGGSMVWTVRDYKRLPCNPNITDPSDPDFNCGL